MTPDRTGALTCDLIVVIPLVLLLDLASFEPLCEGASPGLGNELVELPTSATAPSSVIGIPIISPLSLQRAPTNHLNASSSSDLETSNSLAMLCWIVCSSASVGRTGILVGGAEPDPLAEGDMGVGPDPPLGGVAGTAGDPPPTAERFLPDLVALVRMTNSAFCSVSKTANQVASRLPAR